MKVQYVFYTVGVLFIFASVWFFAREFIEELPDVLKLILLVIAIVITFIIAEFLRGADK
jgi:cell division protein FtsW (lipid II flippase)